MDFVIVSAGVLLLLLLGADVLVTVLHPDGHGGPLNRRLSRAVWELFRLIGRNSDGSVRRRVVGFAGPLLAALVPVGWITLVVIAFALIYYPWAAELLRLQPESGPRWAESLFHSLNAAGTLGMGELADTHVRLRILTAIQGLAGFGLVTAALTYILGVYGIVATMHTLALEIHARLADPAQHPDFSDERTEQEWESWLGDVARRLLRIRQGSGQYPILHYFRPRDDAAALLLQIGRLLDLRERLDEQQHRLLHTPSGRGFDRALTLYLLTLHAHFPGGGAPPAEGAPDPQDARRIHAGVLHYFMLD
jgi:hypothetical protein